MTTSLKSIDHSGVRYKNLPPSPVFSLQIKVNVSGAPLPQLDVGIHWPRGIIVYATKWETHRCDYDSANIKVEDELLHYYDLSDGEFTLFPHSQGCYFAGFPQN